MKKATIKAVASIVGGLVVFFIAFWFFQSSPSTAEATMTRQEAEKIAQEQFQGNVVSVELDDGRYEIEIESDDARYELKLDSETGEIIKLEEKRKRNQDQVAQKSEVEETSVNTENKEEPKQEVKSEEKSKQESEVTEEKSKPKQEAKATEKKSESKSKQQKSTENKSSNVIISEAKAKEIAHKEVSNAKITDFELDSDDGQRYYEIEMYTDSQEVELEIDAYTGEVIMYEIEGRKNNVSISRDEAISIALAEVNDSNAWIDDIELDDGKYEIEIEAPGYEVEIEISAKTGKILDIEYDD